MTIKFLGIGGVGAATPDASGLVYTRPGLKVGSTAILYGNGTQIASVTVDGAGKATWTLGTAPAAGTIITYDGVVVGSGGTVPSAGGGGGGAVTATYLPTLATAPAAVYSLTKLVSTYSGPVAAACAVGDTSATPATVNITSNSDGTPNDAAAIAAYGSNYAIARYFDQSGNAYHTAVQATPAYRQIVTPYQLGPKSSCPQYVSSYDDTGYYDMPTGLVTTRQNATAVAIVGGSTGYEGNNPLGIMSLGNTDVDAAAQMVSGAYGATGGIGGRGNTEQRSPLAIDTRATVCAMVMNASAVKYWRGTESFSAPPFTSVSLPGGRIGGTIFYAPGRYLRSFGYIVYPAALSDADYGTLRGALATIYSITNRTRQIYYGGDSIQCGVGSHETRNKQYYLDKPMTTPAYQYNSGQGGQTLANIVANQDASWFSARYRSDFARNIFVENAGINDINSGATDTAVTGNISTIVARAKAAGFSFGYETLLPFNLTGTKETFRLAVNSWLRANAASQGFTLIDYGDNGPSGYINNEQNHPTSVGGYDKLAAIAAPILNAMLA